MNKAGHTGGRNKTVVANLFIPMNQISKMERVKCSFCFDIMSKNGTRMTKHIEKCRKCPDEVKSLYANKSGYCQKQQDSPGDAEPKAKNPRSDSFGTSFSNSICRSKIPSSMFDSMTKTEKELIDTHLARAIYASGSPLHIVENNYWKIFLNKLRPAYKPPSRHDVSNVLLDNEFSRISANVKEMVATADYLGLMCDGWSNLRNEAIINFVMTLPSSSPILWKTLPTGTLNHSGEYMANEIKKVLEEINPNKVLGIVTDNAANMKNAWTRLKDCYPHLHCYGCISHGLNLLFTDFFKLTTLSVLMSQVTDIVKEIKNSHLSVAAFRDIQKKSASVVTCISLKLPVRTRWGSTVACLDSIQKNKQPLKTLAISENSGLNSTTKIILLSDVFWDRVESFFKLLSPIADAIKKTESNTPMLSSVVETFHFLEDHIFKNLTVSPFSKKEEEAKKVFKKRKDFCLTKIHLAANILDPKFQGRVLTGEQKIDACEAIHNIAASMPEVNKEIMMFDLANYQSKGGIFSKPFIWTAVGITQPINWWKGLCSFTELSKVASRILQLPASSAACERSFSTYSNIHSAKRNRLTTERAGKLVFISQNLKLENIENSSYENGTSITTPQINNLSVNKVPSTSIPWSESEAVNVESDSDFVYESLDECSLGWEDLDSESTSI